MSQTQPKLVRLSFHFIFLNPPIAKSLQSSKVCNSPISPFSFFSFLFCLAILPNSVQTLNHSIRWFWVTCIIAVLCPSAFPSPIVPCTVCTVLILTNRLKWLPKMVQSNWNYADWNFKPNFENYQSILESVKLVKFGFSFLFAGWKLTYFQSSLILFWLFSFRLFSSVLMFRAKKIIYLKPHVLASMSDLVNWMYISTIAELEKLRPSFQLTLLAFI